MNNCTVHIQYLVCVCLLDLIIWVPFSVSIHYSHTGNLTGVDKQRQASSTGHHADSPTWSIVKLVCKERFKRGAVWPITLRFSSSVYLCRPEINLKQLFISIFKQLTSCFDSMYFPLAPFSTSVWVFTQYNLTSRLDSMKVELPSLFSGIDLTY